jgi:hypothetical protein
LNVSSDDSEWRTPHEKIYSIRKIRHFSSIFFDFFVLFKRKQRLHTSLKREGTRRGTLAGTGS